MQWTDVLDCLNKGNSAQLRILRSVNSEDELGPYLAGFANGRGGQVIVGMDVKNCHLLGATIDHQFVDDLVATHCQSLSPVEIEHIRRGDRTILSIQVQESARKPASFKRQCYVISEQSPFLPELFVPNEPIVFQVIESTSGTLSAPTEVTADYAPPSAPSIWQAPEPVAVSPVRVHMNDRQNKTMKHLGRHGSISNKTYRQLFSVSHKTAHLELVDLVEKGLLKSQGSGRSTCYALKA